MASDTALSLELVAQIEDLRQELRDRMPAPPLMAATRRQFDTMSPGDRMAFIKRGGKIHDGDYTGIGRRKTPIF